MFRLAQAELPEFAESYFVTVQAIRAVWQGGTTKPNDEDVDDVERMQYTVTLDQNGRSVSLR